LEIVIIIVLLLLNGLFSMSEIALLSSRRSRLEEKAKQGKSGAKIALDLLKHPERFLSTVQIGITVVGVILGAFGGEAFATKLDPLLQNIGVPITYSYNIAFGVVVTIITYLSIVIGELVPKAIGITYAESITVNLSPLMRFLALVAKPMVFLLTISTKSILKLLGIKDRVEAPVTEEEVKTMIEQGTQHGVFEQEEGDMIKSIFRFGDRKAYAIMTARQEISWLDVNDSLEEVRMQVYNSNFTKFPVCDGDLDDIIGVLSVKDFLKAEKQHQLDLRTLVAQPLYIPENLMAIKILERFREKRTYMGIVVDEFGSTIGMITMHDLVESIFGDLPGFGEPEDPDIVTRDDGSMFIDGSMQIDELRDIINIPALDDEKEEGEYATLGGFMMYKLGKVPHEGDIFTADGYKFEVVDMDGNRVDKVWVKKDEGETNN
jgi:putative hemolysin